MPWSIFTDATIFRPKIIYRIVRRAIFDSSERNRLYKEARDYLRLRAQAEEVYRESFRVSYGEFCPKSGHKQSRSGNTSL